MSDLTFPLLAGLGVGAFFGIKSLTRPNRSDEQNMTRAMNKYDTVLTDQLAQLGYANNWNNPATARFLNEEGLGLLPAAYFGEVGNARGNKLSAADQRWFSTAVARNDPRANAYYTPMQYGAGNAQYQPFGNYNPYAYGYGYGGQGYGYGNQGNGYPYYW